MPAVSGAGVRPLVVANWKMNLGRQAEALAFVRRIRPRLSETTGVEVSLAPPFTVLAALSEVLRPTAISLSAQNMHWEERGAHTGEISPTMLADFCRYVILGHSERRAAGETDDEVRQKAAAALSHGLLPILCVGETAAQRDAGLTHEQVSGQVTAALSGLDAAQVSRCVLAYEPVWAIGSGQAATPAEANRVIGLSLRGALAQGWGEPTARSVRVLYGGSVTPSNAASFLSMPEIDGALVGGASLSESFVDLVRGALG